MLKKNILSNEIKDVELNKLQSKIIEWNKKAEVIQSKFNFILPNYIIDEIIENESSKNFLNLHYLINCAVLSGRITTNNGKILKKEYTVYRE